MAKNQFKQNKLTMRLLISIALLQTIILLLSFGSSIGQANSVMQRVTDCMKNPFANGCRGISAKRSQLWSKPNPNSSLGQVTDQSDQQRPSKSPFADPSAFAVASGASDQTRLQQQQIQQLARDTNRWHQQVIRNSLGLAELLALFSNEQLAPSRRLLQPTMDDSGRQVADLELQQADLGKFANQLDGQRGE